MTAHDKDRLLALTLERRFGMLVTPADANILRRAARTLHRWAELECGDGNDYASWAIERDDTTGKPYHVTYPHDGKSYRTAITDRETGALRRVAALCVERGWYFHHQTDPRGWPLYLSTEPLTDTDYTNGVGVEG